MHVAHGHTPRLDHSNIHDTNGAWYGHRKQKGKYMNTVQAQEMYAHENNDFVPYPMPTVAETTGMEKSIENLKDHFDLEQSLAEIQEIVSNLGKNESLKNANIAKFDAAYNIGTAIKKIHENMEGRAARSEANERIKKILGREHTALLEYKRLAYFEKDVSLADLGVANVAKICGNLNAYKKITGCRYTKINEVLREIDRQRCDDPSLLHDFHISVARTKPSLFCKEIILDAAKKKFGQDYSQIAQTEKGFTVQASKKLYTVIAENAKYEFEEQLQKYKGKEKDKKYLSLEELHRKLQPLMKKMEQLFKAFENEEFLEEFEKFQNSLKMMLR